MRFFVYPILITIFPTAMVYAQGLVPLNKDLKSAVVIKLTPLPFLFESTVGGSIKVDDRGLTFIPYPCSETDKKVSSTFPCNNFLIKDINIDFDDIEKLTRRNYLFIIPNRIFIRKLNGETYRFKTFKRKSLLDSYKLFRSHVALNNSN